jgi:hypothetical protein
MPVWKYELNLVDLAQAVQDEEITPIEYAKGIAGRLKDLLKTVTEKEFIEDIENFIDVFENFNSDDEDDFDCEMNDLYNWADQSLDNKWNGNKLCWIKTS